MWAGKLQIPVKRNLCDNINASDSSNNTKTFIQSCLNPVTRRYVNCCNVV